MILRNMRRGLVVLLTAVTLAVLGAGLYSYVHPLPEEGVFITLDGDNPPCKVGMVSGSLHVVYIVPQSTRVSGKTKKGWGPFYVKRVSMGSLGGGGIVASGGGVPFWFACLLLAAYPMLSFVRGPWRRRRRRKRGLCIQCGYNLTGLSENRCPECGRPFETTSPRMEG